MNNSARHQASWGYFFLLTAMGLDQLGRFARRNVAHLLVSAFHSLFLTLKVGEMPSRLVTPEKNKGRAVPTNRSPAVI